MREELKIKSRNSWRVVQLCNRSIPCRIFPGIRNIINNYSDIPCLYPPYRGTHNEEIDVMNVFLRSLEAEISKILNYKIHYKVIYKVKQQLKPPF